MKFSGLILFLLSAFAPVVAMAEYWVSIASFKNRDSAESALVNAQKQIEESLKVLGASTEKGYFLGLLQGPMVLKTKRGVRSLCWAWQASTGDGFGRPRLREQQFGGLRALPSRPISNPLNLIVIGARIFMTSKISF